MIKRTPQEIADFFQGYVAMNENGCWYIYEKEPKIDSFGVGWIGFGSNYIMDSLIEKNETIDWKESLCKPNTYLEIESDIHEIADYYGITSRLQLLMEECAELSVEASHFIRGRVDIPALEEEIADVEIVLEQVKYLMKLGSEDLAKIKLRKIIRQFDRIAKESADNPQIVREKSTDEEEQGCLNSQTKKKPW